MRVLAGLFLAFIAVAESDVPVVILASSLLEADEPPAIPIETPAPS